MKRKSVIAILSLLIPAMAFADTAIKNGSLDSDAQASVDVCFLYDPMSMHRYTFGFTESTELSWDGDNGDLKGSVLNLTTSQDPYNTRLYYGSASVNFYWILRTDSALKAYIYMDSPLVDEDAGELLDFKLTFDSIQGSYVFRDRVLDSSYGIENGKVIYSREAGSTMDVEMDYLTVKIETSRVERDQDAHHLSGTIGVHVVME